MVKRGSTFPKPPHIERSVLVLQGGGAMGAFQAGVYEALAQHHFTPDWIAGTSIGAINGAIIAGNKPEYRLSRLQEFWEAASHSYFNDFHYHYEQAEHLRYLWSTFSAILYGQPNLFKPRFPNPYLTLRAPTLKDVSFYDTSALREMLLRLIDFKVLNQKQVRLSLGAVHVTSGQQRYFDNAYQELTVEHVMASSALPPAFPAISIDGEWYWDGGLYSNTPLEVVLDDVPRVNTLCFMVDLFNPIGEEPKSIIEVLGRRKNIVYSSQADRSVCDYQEKHNLRRAVRALYEALSESQRKDPALKALRELGCHTTMEIVHLNYAEQSGENSLQDTDFSQVALKKRWSLGYQDASVALKKAAWLAPVAPHIGVIVYKQNPKRETQLNFIKPSFDR